MKTHSQLIRPMLYACKHINIINVIISFQTVFTINQGFCFLGAFHQVIQPQTGSTFHRIFSVPHSTDLRSNNIIVFTQINFSSIIPWFDCSRINPGRFFIPKMLGPTTTLPATLSLSRTHSHDSLLFHYLFPSLQEWICWHRVIRFLVYFVHDTNTS